MPSQSHSSFNRSPQSNDPPFYADLSILLLFPSSWAQTTSWAPYSLTSSNFYFYILLTVQHLDVILVNDQIDALFLNVFISTPLHVSKSKCSPSGGPTCINTPSGITHSSGWLSGRPARHSTMCTIMKYTPSQEWNRLNILQQAPSWPSAWNVHVHSIPQHNSNNKLLLSSSSSSSSSTS